MFALPVPLCHKSPHRVGSLSCFASDLIMVLLYGCHEGYLHNFVQQRSHGFYTKIVLFLQCYTNKITVLLTH